MPEASNEGMRAAILQCDAECLHRAPHSLKCNPTTQLVFERQGFNQKTGTQQAQLLLNVDSCHLLTAT